jgi:hypothetical protein
MQADPTNFLMSAGVKSFKFTNHGDTVKGRITSLDMQQQRDIKTNEPKFWNDGKPMMQLRIVLDTGLAEGPEDDGLRAIYVRGQMQQSVREAIKAAGATTIEEGGTLGVQYTGDGTPTNPAFDGPKLYRAQYQPPVATPTSINADDLL